jgi:hypothetical protein
MKITGKFYVRLDNKDEKLFTYNQVFKKNEMGGFPYHSPPFVSKKNSIMDAVQVIYREFKSTIVCTSVACAPSTHRWRCNHRIL